MPLSQSHNNTIKVQQCYRQRPAEVWFDVETTLRRLRLSFTHHGSLDGVQAELHFNSVCFDPLAGFVVELWHLAAGMARTPSYRPIAFRRPVAGLGHKKRDIKVHSAPSIARLMTTL